MIYYLIRFFAFLSYFLNYLYIGILITVILEKGYTEQFHNFIISLSYDCIYFYSKFQIMSIRFKNSISKFVDSKPFLLKFKNFVNQKLSSELYNKIEKFEEYGFSISNIIENGVINKKIIYDDNYVDTIEKSEIKFILIEFFIVDEYCNKYKIDLKTDTFNYYMVGNILNKNFFMFYLNNHLNIKTNFNDQCKFYIKIIDNDINELELYFTAKNEKIIIYKNHYTIQKDDDYSK
jgi:hypothetical protein